MLIDAKGKYGEFLFLSVQTKPDNLDNEILRKSKIWAPKNAKSFTVENIRNKSVVSGEYVEEVTGYANFIVYYFSTKKEGEHLIS